MISQKAMCWVARLWFLFSLWSLPHLSPVCWACRPSCPLRKGEGGWKQQIVDNPNFSSKQLREMKKKGDFQKGWAAVEKSNAPLRRRPPNTTEGAASPSEEDGPEDGGPSAVSEVRGGIQALSVRGGGAVTKETPERDDQERLTESQLDEIGVCDSISFSSNDSGTDATEETELEDLDGQRHSQLARLRQATYTATRLKEVELQSEHELEYPEMREISQAIHSANTAVEVFYEAGGIPAILESVDAHLKLTEDEVMVSDAILAAEAILKLAKCCQAEDLSSESFSSQIRFQQLLEVVLARASWLPLKSVNQALLGLAALHESGGSLFGLGPKATATALVTALATRTIEMMSEGSSQELAEAAFAWATAIKLIEEARTERVTETESGSTEALQEVASVLLKPWVGNIESFSRIWGLDPNQMTNLAWAAVTLHVHYPAQIGHQSQDLVYELAKEAYARYKDASQQTAHTDSSPDDNQEHTDLSHESTEDASASSYEERKDAVRNDLNALGSGLPGAQQASELHSRMLGPRGISTLVWACAVFGIHDQPFFTMAVLEAGRLIEAMEIGDVSNLAWGLATAGFYDQFLTEQMLSMAEESFDEMCPESLGKMSRSFAIWGHQEADSFVARALAEVQQSKDFARGELEDAEKFHLRDYVSIVFAFANLVKNPDSKLQKWSILMGRLWVVLEKQLEKLTPSLLIDLVWSLSALELLDETILHQTCGMFSQSEVVEELVPLDASRLLWALSKAQSGVCSHALLARLHRAVVGRLEECSAKDLIAAFSALVAMGFRDCYHQALSLSEQQISHLNPSSLASFLWVFAALKIKDEDTLALVIQDLEPKLLSFSPADLSKTAWSLANLHDCHGPTAKQIFPSLLKQIAKDLTLFSPKELSCIIASAQFVLGAINSTNFMLDKISDFMQEHSSVYLNTTDPKKVLLSRHSAFNVGKCQQLLEDEHGQ